MVISKAAAKVRGDSAQSSVDPAALEETRPQTPSAPSPRSPGKKGPKLEAPATTASMASSQETLGCYAMRLASDNENSCTKFLKHHGRTQERSPTPDT